MHSYLDKIGKRFRFDWIYRRVDYHFAPGGRYAVLGPNGSGKSTLLRALCGHLTPTEGTVRWEHAGRQIARDDIFRHVAYAAPYVELMEELTLTELLDFQRRFVDFHPALPDTAALIDRMELRPARRREVRFFSSGMKQRVKLALAVCSRRPLLILDEPTTNLDAAATQWYLDLVREFGADRTIVVASNVPTDYSFCDRSLNILDYKPVPKRRRAPKTS